MGEMEVEGNCLGDRGFKEEVFQKVGDGVH
jgi:hypothetical protein